VSVLSHSVRHLRIGYGDDRLVGRHITVRHTCHQGGFTAGLDHQKRLRKAWSRIGPAMQPDSKYLNRNYRNIAKGPFILLVQINEFWLLELLLLSDEKGSGLSRAAALPGLSRSSLFDLPAGGLLKCFFREDDGRR
jgi:hypothetical protein